MPIKTINLTIGIILLFVFILWADYEVIIGEGTSLTQSNPYDPIRTNSGSANMILRSELPAGAGGQILAIYFYMDPSSLNPSGYTKDIDMFMCQTTETQITTSTPLTGGTLVYSSPASYDNIGWITYNLSTPFHWDSDNLIITMNSELTYIPPGFPPDNYFRYTTAPGNLAGWVNRNDWVQPSTLTDGSSHAINSQRPNIKLKFSGAIGIDETRFFENISINAFPSPFNSAVSIVAPDESQIDIYDVDGRLVSELGYQQNARTIIWRPDALMESGIYFVKATTGSKSDMKKVIYLK